MNDSEHEGERCLHSVGRWGDDLRCGLAQFHPVHDPLGARYFPNDVRWPMEVHPFDTVPMCDEDGPPNFAEYPDA